MRNANSAFLDFVRLVVSGSLDELSQCVAADPSVAVSAAAEGASRKNAKDFYFKEISHYLYAGDTALHIAAAAFRRPVAEFLVANGASHRTGNRRGAQPLHYAADTNHWDPVAQAETIAYLLSVGADPNARDNSGVTPLHRAVRTRSLSAVRKLLAGGADPASRNRSGSTALHLAVQTTGRGGAGSEFAREQQLGIIRLLLECGASASDEDGRGRTVYRAASSEWARDLLNNGGTQG